MQNWNISPRTILEEGPLIPVLVIHDLEPAVHLAQAIVRGGIRVLEITLRSDVALEAIQCIGQEVPEALVGAGTVTSPADLEAVARAGGKFAISPGLTPSLLRAANQGDIPLIPGIATASELMQGLEMSYDTFKFFPAEKSGGISMLRALAGPFPGVRFCPTGGITGENYLDYLALETVTCVGGSWIVPGQLLADRDWEGITLLIRQTLAAASTT
ncbi:bifunctional 4-hydroxy-2-oxoglutarate aldolase/2-dehydro-3-deoxy-phosphogluconate aldolase [Desulfolithobacter sp.]